MLCVYLLRCSVLTPLFINLHYVTVKSYFFRQFLEHFFVLFNWCENQFRYLDSASNGFYYQLEGKQGWKKQINITSDTAGAHRLYQMPPTPVESDQKQQSTDSGLGSQRPRNQKVPLGTSTR